jgi:hypothetical protein
MHGLRQYRYKFDWLLRQILASVPLRWNPFDFASGASIIIYRSIRLRILQVGIGEPHYEARTHIVHTRLFVRCHADA